MPAEIRRLPVSPMMVAGEALDGYLERLAAANGMEHPQMLRRLDGARTTFLTVAPDEHAVLSIAGASSQPAETLRAGTLADLPGIDATGLDPADRTTWRTVAARGWPPEHGTALCPTCMATDGVWRLTWRHPWVTACTRHGVWLASTCPSCRRRFRTHRTALRPVDAPGGTCGNPLGVRGANCPQPLNRIVPDPAPRGVLGAQERIDTAIAGVRVPVLGEPTEPDVYLRELRALTVLLLHLAIQPGSDPLAPWAPQARADRERTTGGRGARWGLAPPADLRLRGRALAAADGILAQPDHHAAADALHPWTELTPACNEGQLGWLADHTTMTPTLSGLVMAATATRRRLATLLDRDQPTRLPNGVIPQVLPADLYADQLAGMLDVTDRTGRLFVSLCLARRHANAENWAAAAELIGLPADVGVKTARACSADLLVRPDVLVDAVDGLAGRLDPGVDYRAREDVVRRLAQHASWYRPWARAHHRGSHDASRSHAVSWLWTEWVHGHLDSSPGWQQHPDSVGRGYYRRYAQRLTPEARRALNALADAAQSGGGGSP